MPTSGPMSMCVTHVSTTALVAFATLLLFAAQLSWPQLRALTRPPIDAEAHRRAPMSAEWAAIERVVAEADQAEPGRCEDLTHDLLNDLGRKGIMVGGAAGRRIGRLTWAE